MVYDWGFAGATIFSVGSMAHDMFGSFAKSLAHDMLFGSFANGVSFVLDSSIFLPVV
jgi:hypothetical protein